MNFNIDLNDLKEFNLKDLKLSKRDIVNLSVVVAFIFIALVINDFLKNKKVRRETINFFSTTINEILNSLQSVWDKYQEATKNIYQQKKIVIDANALHLKPAEFRPMLPDWRWNVTKLYPIPLVLLKNERKQIDEFCSNIIKIIFLYEQIQDLGSGSYDANHLLPELRQKWEILVIKVLEQADPLKKHNKSLHADGQGRTA